MLVLIHNCVVALTLDIDEETVQQQHSLWEQAQQTNLQRKLLATKIIHGEPFTETKSTFQVSPFSIQPHHSNV